jgi:hypothetical protein
MPLCTFVQQSRGEINIKEFAGFSTANQQTEKLGRMHHKRINYGDLQKSNVQCTVLQKRN